MGGEIEIPTKHGGYKVGEYIHGLPQLEARNVTAGPTSPLRQLPPAWQNPPYGSRNDKAG
jgi:hypothetical protein